MNIILYMYHIYYIYYILYYIYILYTLYMYTKVDCPACYFFIAKVFETFFLSGVSCVAIAFSTGRKKHEKGVQFRIPNKNIAG